MSKTNSIDPDRIQLLEVKTVKGNIDVGDDLDNCPLAGFKTDFDVKSMFRLEDQLVRFLFTARFHGLSKDEKPLPLTAEFTFDFLFKVEGLEEYVVDPDKKKDQFRVSSVLGHTLIAIIYSTARGIILTRTQGTVVKDGILLPVINTQKLLNLTGKANDKG
ncbi:hypothetical protein BC792_14110 [Sphingobacterium allocomposti]|uniref:Preprotein translocase subunit SecB n=1 Tax=Sphingobacterium allocomposti TaxID=415956 RepID=A0A5S5CVL2_9SPHI|nr:hypothetical protein [Sphingobacterium composti Yoo et al. 2007 non Ten et al. 2007]TYP87018.1 hypothetical protein BC792_14110 [Sphingobacterium composti Yoo et al. 2007 non Ten et al. 2007]